MSPPHFEEFRIPRSKFKRTRIPYITWTNITGLVNRSIAASKIVEGNGVIQVLHTTAGLIVNEGESGLTGADLPKALAELFPEKKYAHDREERLRKLPGEPRNGKSHLQSIIAAHPSLPLIIHNSRLQLGTWQTILLYDFDSNERAERKVIISINGTLA